MWLDWRLPANFVIFMLYTDNRPVIVDSKFAPVPPPGELDETYASSSILAHSLHYVNT